MKDRLERLLRPTPRAHPHAWLWEPLEADPGFVLRAFFGGKAAYLDGKLALFFTAKQPPWCGVFVCTDRVHHAALQAEFPELRPHPVLPKWLYVPEAADQFERTAQRLVTLVLQRDPRIGVLPQTKKRRASKERIKVRRGSARQKPKS